MTCLILALGAFYALALVAVMAAWPGVTPGAALALALPGAVLAAWYLLASGASNRREAAAANERGRNRAERTRREHADVGAYGRGEINYATLRHRAARTARQYPAGPGERTLHDDLSHDEREAGYGRAVDRRGTANRRREREGERVRE